MSIAPLPFHADLEQYNRQATKAQMESGFMWACEYGQTSVVAFLLEQGLRIDARPHGETGLHWAAYGGHAAVVNLLLRRKTPVEVKDRRYDNTPLGWALHGWLYPPPGAKRRNHWKIVALLVAAGATVDRQWLKNDEEGQRVRADRRMLAALSGSIPRIERTKRKRQGEGGFR